MTGFAAGESHMELTLSSHEFLYVFLQSPGLRLGHVHAIEEVVAHQVVFGIACHIDSLIRKGEINFVLY